MFPKTKLTDKFVLVQDERAPHVECIKIVRGKFKGVLYHYHCVKFSEGRVSFQNFVLDNPRRCNVQLQEFTKLTGDILMHCISNEEGEFNDIEPF